MISKFLMILLMAFFSQASFADFQTLKSGFIYTQPDFNTCGILVKTFPSDKIVSLEVVNNATSGLYCPGHTQTSFKCDGSRCVALQAYDSSQGGKKLYKYLIVSDIGNFYYNTIECTPDANGLPINCANPSAGPSFYASTAFSSEVKPTLFQGSSYYLPNNQYAPAQDRATALTKATTAAEFECAKYWNTCTVEHALDITTSLSYGGESFTLFLRGH